MQGSAVCVCSCCRGSAVCVAAAAVGRLAASLQSAGSLPQSGPGMPGGHSWLRWFLCQKVATYTQCSLCLDEVPARDAAHHR